MVRSLRSRLLLAFAFVIVLSLAVSAVGSFLLLRDQQRESAEERFGRLAAPITLGIALLEEAGLDAAGIQAAADDYAESFGVRVLLIDAEGRVLLDSESTLRGETVDAFERPDVPVTRRGDARFRMAKYSADGEDLLLFAPADESLHLSSNQLIELQTLIYGLQASNTPPEVIEALVAQVPDDEDPERTVLLPNIQPLVAVSEDEITSVWQDLIPQLAIAAAIAVPVSAAAALLISQSVTGRLARMTRAAQEMAKGNYDQRVALGGDDEVGRLAQAFDVMSRQVSRSHQMMRDFLANVSHELKTPLTSIQGFSQAMEEGAIGSEEEQREAARIINEEAQRMRRLVDDLIELSRLESGQTVMERGRVDLRELLSECAKRFEWRLRETGATLRLDLNSVPPVQGDGRRLEQAFSNLIENAARHTPEGGEITVRAAAENGAVRVAVHNTGSYIPPEDLGRLFERFFQLERHRSRDGNGGAGLGLAIVEEVVQAHAGSVRATSDRERGTEFEVTLPLS